MGRFHKNYGWKTAAAVFCFMFAAVPVFSGCGGGAATTPAATQAQSGQSIETAIPSGSIGWQTDVLTGTRCGGDGFYRQTGVRMVVQDGRHFDVVSATCTAGGDTREFWFDVSSCFPCPD